MTLAEIDQRITEAIASANGGGEAALDAVMEIYSLWGYLRRSLWAPPYKAEARRLMDRCWHGNNALCEAHGIMNPGQPPRFEGFPDSGGNYHEHIN